MTDRTDRTAAQVAVVLLATAAAWGFAVVAAPWVAASAGRRSLSAFASAAVYAIGSLICHQRPDRSFHTVGVQWPVCARCAGLYVSAGAFALVQLAAARSRRPAVPRRKLLAALCLAGAPTAISWCLERAGIVATGNATRAALAVPLGLTVPVLIACAAAQRIGARAGRPIDLR